MIFLADFSKKRLRMILCVCATFAYFLQNFAERKLAKFSLTHEARKFLGWWVMHTLVYKFIVDQKSKFWLKIYSWFLWANFGNKKNVFILRHTVQGYLDQYKFLLFSYIQSCWRQFNIFLVFIEISKFVFFAIRKIIRLLQKFYAVFRTDFCTKFGPKTDFFERRALYQFKAQVFRTSRAFKFSLIIDQFFFNCPWNFKITLYQFSRSL